MGSFDRIIAGVSLLLLFPLCAWPAAHKKYSRKAPVKKLAPAPDLGFVGQIIYVNGNVVTQRVKAPSWLTAYANMPDYLLDKVKTGPDSKTTLEFKDGTQVAVNHDTEVYIDTSSSVKDITKRTLLKRVYLTLGTIWCKVTKQKPDESFVVETHAGVLGVRGTEFAVSTAGNDEMKVYVEEGTVMAGPSADQLTEAIPAGNEADIVAGKLRQEAPYVLGAHIGLDIFGQPWWAHGLVDIGAQAWAGGDAGDIAVDVARDYAASYVPYGGYANSFFGSSNFFGGGPPPHPSNLQPQGMVSTYTPTFSWSGIKDAKQYSVLISKAPFQKDMSTDAWQWIARVDKTFITYPYVANTLVPGTTYYWTVVPVDENGKVVGKGANPVTFTMAPQSQLGQPNFYPAILHPMNEAASSLFPEFTWDPMSGAASYVVMVSPQLKGDQLDGDLTVANLTSTGTRVDYDLTQQPLKPGATYYWSVVALDSAGKAYSRPSPPTSFTLPPASEVGPTPVFPISEVKAGPLHIEWRGWLDRISGYRVVVSQNPNLSQPVFSQFTTTPWLDVQDTAKFVPGTTYYWAVTALNLEGKPAGVMGRVASFTISH